jgi:hypothetical protein
MNSANVVGFRQTQQVRQHIPVGGTGEATATPGLLVLLVPRAQPLRTKVKGIPKWLVNAAKNITARHKHALEGRRAGPRMCGQKDRFV